MFTEQVGWPELVNQTAQVLLRPRRGTARTAILAGNYGELGAINLYGPAPGCRRP